MSLPTENRCYRLERRPQGRAPVSADDLVLHTEPIPALQTGQALVRTLYLSLDPSNRIWMSEQPSYLPPVPLGAVMRGLGVGEVIASEREDFPVGSHVLGWTGFQEHAVMDDETDEGPYTRLPDPLPAPLTMFLGALGHTGITAWLGLEDIGKPQPGETVLVSAAAGAVGGIAGQLAKARGARVVGIAGGASKCAHVVEALGFDACVDYRADDFPAQLAAAVPDGIDVDFENVGGPIMDEVFTHLNIGARVVLSGMISQYESGDAKGGWDGQKNIGLLIMRRASMAGFLVLDHAERFPQAIEELAGLYAGGRMRSDETIVEGLETTLDAINGLFTGSNTGKSLIKVA